MVNLRPDSEEENISADCKSRHALCWRCPFGVRDTRLALSCTGDGWSRACRYRTLPKGACQLKTVAVSLQVLSWRFEVNSCSGSMPVPDEDLHCCSQAHVHQHAFHFLIGIVTNVP
ncbi:hypothetical protein NDU88_000144 [Pleurodeles waltl]|uniref:Uncharacterized protein n=1 Tax=Pleurodeles waltl TaxID=8319 RepID=A0AAV7UP55_PLEWA|nr:hypothetical protein NDU88_000144 [Pleurodeles waltl]